MKTPTVRFDIEAQALYIRFSTEHVAETVELSDTVYIDVDENGNPVGFEVLDVDSSLLSKLRDLPDGTDLRRLLSDRAA